MTPTPDVRELSERELVEIWQESLEDVLTLVTPLNDDQWSAATPCPGWSVGDIVAHLIDVEGVLARELRPDHEPDWETLDHVNNDFGRFTEVGVDYRRGKPKDSVVGELRDVAAKRRQQLDETPPGTEVIGPLGNPTTMDRLLRVRILDIWMHEQDIRTAIGSDGGWDTRPAQVSLEQIRRALPIVWSRNCRAPQGSAVRVTVTGPALTAEMAAIVDDDGRGRAVETVDTAAVHLSLSWPDLVALSAGRIRPEDAGLQGRITIEGDMRLGETLLAALAITP
jgi:uncharacterized protein (TIGR03083 family)